MVFIAVVVTDATLRALLVVSVACLLFNAVMTLVPPTLSDPFNDVAPYTVKVELSVAGPSDCSSPVAVTSRPWMSALHVTLATLTTELVVSAACFPEMVVLMSTPAK